MIKHLQPANDVNYFTPPASTGTPNATSRLIILSGIR